jgi:hypothetical protein
VVGENKASVTEGVRYFNQPFGRVVGIRKGGVIVTAGKYLYVFIHSIILSISFLLDCITKDKICQQV